MNKKDNWLPPGIFFLENARNHFNKASNDSPLKRESFFFQWLACYCNHLCVVDITAVYFYFAFSSNCSNNNNSVFS